MSWPRALMRGAVMPVWVPYPVGAHGATECHKIFKMFPPGYAAAPAPGGERRGLPRVCWSGPAAGLLRRRRRCLRFLAGDVLDKGRGTGVNEHPRPGDRLLVAVIDLDRLVRGP